MLIFTKEIVHKSPYSKGIAVNGNIMKHLRNSIALVQLIRRFHENCPNRNRWRVVLPSLAIPKSGLEIRFALQPARRLAMAGSKLKKNMRESTRPMKYAVEWCWSNLDSTVTPSLPLPHKKNVSTSTFMWMTNFETWNCRTNSFWRFHGRASRLCKWVSANFLTKHPEESTISRKSGNVETLYVWHAWFWCRKAVNVCWMKRMDPIVIPCHGWVEMLGIEPGNYQVKLLQRLISDRHPAHVNMLKSMEKCKRIHIEDLSI